MPELPEVEIVRENLARWTVDAEIVAVASAESGAEPRLPRDLATLIGRRFLHWRRRGKYLLGDLDDARTLLCHLGMTGKWVADPGERPYQRLVIELRRGESATRRIALVDVRRLGRVWLGGRQAIQAHPRLAALGPEPGSADFDGAGLHRRLGLRRLAVKSALMDQRVVAGLGNICVLEACYRAGVHPHTRCAHLSRRQWDALAAGARAHIADTLRNEAGDEVRYVNEGGASHFAVYGRAGQPCGRCGAVIVRQVLAGRPSFFCPVCQPSVSGPLEEGAP